MVRRVVDIRARGTWDEATAVDRISLDHDARHRRRFRFCGEGGTSFLLDRAEPVVLLDGDGLALDDDSMVVVRAAPERLMDVRATSADALLRLAWHIGNRHLPAEIRADAIRLRDDHVIAEMLRGLGATVTLVDAPFLPEGGAYARTPGGHHHGHDHGHDHHHGHDDHDH